MKTLFKEGAKLAIQLVELAVIIVGLVYMITR